MKFISLLTLCLLNFSILGAIPVQALPGETQETVTKKFYSNSFFRGLKLYQGYFPSNPPVCCIRGSGLFSFTNGKFLETSYSILEVNKLNLKGPGIYKDYNFTYGTRVNLDRNIVFSEVLSLDLNSQNQKYENKKYDYRTDSLITELINEVWGQSLADDFKNARFTDIFFSRSSGVRQIYQGKQFAYQISYYARGQVIRINVIIPEYIKSLRVQDEFEERQ